MQLGKQEVLTRIEEIAERVAAAEDLEIVEVELLGGGKARVLRLTIDKPTGVTHGDCELISQRVGEALDQQDIIPGDSYTLEVSSPGIERRLRKPRDFERFLGQKTRFVLREPVDGQKRWEGVLAGFADGMITLEPAPGRTVQFPLAQVDKANLKYEWGK